MSSSLLFSPLDIRGVVSRNRVMISPMCMYAAADDGVATGYHLVHLGRFALGGAGIVVAEATAVAPDGRISASDLGLWSDDQRDALAPVAAFLTRYGAVPGIQLGHAGRKGCTHAPWAGGAPIADPQTPGAWQVVGPTGEAAGPGWQTPREMTSGDIAESVAAWASAARRAADAGFRFIELHGAHGYLLHSFQSPISNTRTDEYGGSEENRHRYPLEVVDAVRAAIPDDCVLAYRVSSVDGVEGGITIEDTVRFAALLGEHGVDMVDTSSGGVVTDRRVDTRVRRGYGFHAPFAAALKEGAEVRVATVGLVVDPRQAELLVERGDTDLVVIGREALRDPSWAHHARESLVGRDYESWHVEAGFFLQQRVRVLDALEAAGETPTDRWVSDSA